MIALRTLWIINPLLIALGISALTGCSQPPTKSIQNVKIVLSQYDGKYPETVEFKRGLVFLDRAMQLQVAEDAKFALFRSYCPIKEQYDSAYYWFTCDPQTPIERTTNELIDKLNSMSK